MIIKVSNEKIRGSWVSLFVHPSMPALIDKTKMQRTNSLCPPAENTLQIKCSPALFCCILPPITKLSFTPFQTKAPIPITAGTAILLHDSPENGR